MHLTVRYQLNIMFLLGAVSVCFICPTLLGESYSSLLDSASRSNPNLPFIATYQFWWTSLTYLSLFFMLLLVAVILSLGVTISYPVLLLTFWCVCLYSTETLDYSPLSFSHAASMYSNFGSNQLLSNALNKYHPFVLYLSFTLALFTYSLRVLSWQTASTFCVSTLNRLWTKARWVVILINLLALWMGSWWALQEGTWGGWWNWDSSEVFGLGVTFAFLTLTHSISRPSTDVFFCVKFHALVVIVLCSYVFMQINFELVSHNFGSKFFFFFNNNLFFLEIVSVSLVTLLLLSRLLSLRKNLEVLDSSQQRSIIQFSTRSLTTLIPSLVALVWVAWSFRPLMSHFLWKFFEINALNSEGTIQLWHVLTLLFLFILLTPKSYLDVWAPVVLLVHAPIWLLALVSVNPTKLRFTLLHFTLLLFTTLNTLLVNSTLFSWLSVAPYSYLTLETQIEFQAAPLWVLDTGVVEIINPWRSAGNFTSTDWNQFSATNAPALNFFSLELSHSTSRNLYILGESYSNVLLDLEVPLIGSLNILFLAVLAILL
jgi:hypothetical protein